MPFYAAALDEMADHIATLATHAQIHSGDPGVAGTDNVVAGVARVPIAWDPASGGGDMTLVGTEVFTGASAGAAATWISLWSQLATGGTAYGKAQLTGDQAFNAAGEYTLNEVSVNGSTT